MRSLAAGTRIRVLTTLHELEAEASRWHALDEAATTPAQGFAWIRACAESFEQELRIVLVDDGDDLVAAAPLAVGKDGALELVGSRDLSEPGDFAYRNEAALRALAGELARTKEGLAIFRLPAGSPSLSALKRAFRGRGAIVVRGAGSTPVLRPFGDPKERFSSRRRGDLRRARRRAEEIGVLTAEVLAPGPEELGPFLGEFFEVEAAGWKGAAGTALAHDLRRRLFYELYSEASAAEGNLRLCRLVIGDATAAVQLAVEHSGRLWLLKIGYDERFARSSPGTLLLLETARWASERGLEAIEFLGQREPWTRVWTDEEEACVNLRAYPATVPGARAMLGDAARHSRRLLVDRAARSHVAGHDLDAAVVAANRIAEGGDAIAIAFWDAESDSPQQVDSISIEALEALGSSGLDGYLAIKPAAYGFSRSRIEAILTRGEELGIPVHFDSTGPEAADPSWELLQEIARPALGCTLPGGWQRSLEDAERALDLGLRIRLVKGQWPDPNSEALDERAGFLALVEVLAGRAAHVAVATHDRSLAVASIKRLEAAGTQVEHELMFGLPRGRKLARTRIYIPFGHPYLPYEPRRARRSARVAGWFARDVIRGG